MSLSKLLRFSLDPSSITSLGITLMLMLMGFIYYYFYSNSSSSATKKQKSSSIQKKFKYDVFMSFRGEDSRKNFVDHLYHALMEKGVYAYKGDEIIQKGERISDDLFSSIEDSKFYIIVFSKNYASSSWCLEELVKIMECHKMPGHTAYPVFYDVEPTEVRKQIGAVGEKAFSKNKNKEAAEKWKGALKEATDLAGWELDGHEAKFIKEIVEKISLALYSPVLNKLVEASFAVKVDLTPSSGIGFIIMCLLAFAGIKAQSVTGFPFKTHPNAIKVSVTSLLIYAFASMAELVVSVARLDHTSVYAIIARLGRISSLCLCVTSLAILICI